MEDPFLYEEGSIYLGQHHYYPFDEVRVDLEIFG